MQANIIFPWFNCTVDRGCHRKIVISAFIAFQNSTAWKIRKSKAKWLCGYLKYNTHFEFKQWLCWSLQMWAPISYVYLLREKENVKCFSMHTPGCLQVVALSWSHAVSCKQDGACNWLHSMAAFSWLLSFGCIQYLERFIERKK